MYNKFTLLGEGHSWPGMRGGHQLCVDSTSQILYMFGGWDGEQDLADLWSYDIVRGKWTCLCRDASEEVRIYVLFIMYVYVHVFMYVYMYVCTCMYVYTMLYICMYVMYIVYVHCTRTFIFFESQGGPSPRSCHKMCLDSDNQVLYILGQYLDQDTRTSLFTVTIPVDL